MIFRNFFILIPLCLFFGMPLQAQDIQEKEENGFEEPIKEFNFMESVYNQEKQEFQFSIYGNHFEREGLNSYNLRYEVEYGVTERLQAEASIRNRRARPLETDVDRQSFYLLEAGLLYNLIDTKKFAAIVSAVGVIPLNEKKSMPEGEDIHVYQFEPHLVLATQLGRAQLHLDSGLAFRGGDREYFTNLGAILPIGDFVPMLEVLGSYENETEVFLSPGLGWSGLESFNIIAGSTFDLNRNSKQWGINLGLIYEFKAGQ
ncbi:hypothetical protein D770_06980 [Flammeovirgaceae bacterium 311]|nr:hypothetical protein D770_06980 [Flammeovirgaceae bacterium 311]